MRRTKLAVARDDGLLIEQVGDETVVYDAATKEAHCLSPLAAVVFGHCDGETTVDELAEVASQRLGGAVDRDRVLDALAQLEDKDLLVIGPSAGMSRREIFHKGALVAGTAAFASPLITSVAAPSPVAAATATCGTLLCCPCCQSESFNKEECCFIANVTVNCQCTGNRDAFPGEPTSGKYCKPAGTAAPDDATCQAMFSSSTARQTACSPQQAAGNSCTTCT